MRISHLIVLLVVLYMCWLSAVYGDDNGYPSDADPNEFPYQAQLEVKHKQQHRCGGSLIHPCYVLTAKHCVAGLDKDDLMIYLGEHNISDSDEFRSRHRVVTIIRHPTRDIALLLLKKAPVHDWISPIRLAAKDPTIGTAALATGWGITETLDPDSALDVLQQTAVVISPDSVCNDIIDPDLASHELCAGRDITESDYICHGDSGGPLVVRDRDTWTQVGVISRGTADCVARMNFHVAYVSVAAVRSWIKRYIPEATPDNKKDCPCLHTASWYDGSAEDASLEDDKCYLRPARSGCLIQSETKSFIQDNRYYIRSSRSTFCVEGEWDSCNCRIMDRPAGSYIYNNKLYVQNLDNGRCPQGTTRQQGRCLLHTPPLSTQAFFYQTGYYNAAFRQCADPEVYTYVGGEYCELYWQPGPNPEIRDNGFYSDPVDGVCPAGSRMETDSTCFFQRAPWATVPYIRSTTGRFWTTARRACHEGMFDGEHCYVMSPPEGAIALIENDKYYYWWP